MGSIVAATLLKKNLIGFYDEKPYIKWDKKNHCYHLTHNLSPEMSMSPQIFISLRIQTTSKR